VTGLSWRETFCVEWTINEEELSAIAMLGNIRGIPFEESNEEHFEINMF